MDKDSYMAGKYVGMYLAAARSAAEFSGTWPSNALQKDTEEIEEWGKIHGMKVEFKDGFINFMRHKPPELTVVS